MQPVGYAGDGPDGQPILQTDKLGIEFGRSRARPRLADVVFITPRLFQMMQAGGNGNWRLDP